MFNLTLGSTGDSHSSARSGCSTGDSHSSPFVDYLNDTLYVGDNNGYLFKIGGVFNGTPAKRTSASSPAWGDSSGALLVASSSGKFLTSPVLDYTDNKVWLELEALTACLNSWTSQPVPPPCPAASPLPRAI